MIFKELNRMNNIQQLAIEISEILPQISTEDNYRLAKYLLSKYAIHKLKETMEEKIQYLELHGWTWNPVDDTYTKIFTAPLKNNVFSKGLALHYKNFSEDTFIEDIVTKAVLLAIEEPYQELLNKGF